MLQVLLSQVHRLRALELLGRFLDLGPWAVNLALSVGIFPYVLNSKFNWKPVFKSQINRAFLPTTPNRTARGLFRNSKRSLIIKLKTSL